MDLILITDIYIYIYTVFLLIYSFFSWNGGMSSPSSLAPRGTSTTLFLKTFFSYTLYLDIHNVLFLNRKQLRKLLLWDTPNIFLVVVHVFILIATYIPPLSHSSSCHFILFLNHFKAMRWDWEATDDLLLQHWSLLYINTIRVQRLKLHNKEHQQNHCWKKQSQ